MSVGKSNVELLCARNDGLSRFGTNVLGNFTAVGSVVHQQQFDVFLTSDQKLSETTGEHVSGLGGLLLTDLGHFSPTTEATALRVINTSWSSP